MDDKVVMIWKVAVVIQSRYYHMIFAWRDREKSRKLVSIVGDLSEIRNEFLSNASLHRYRYVNQLLLER
jgi:hypothetical protein